MAKLTKEQKLAKLQAQIANLEHEIELESNPELKEVSDQLTVKLKTIGQIRKKRAQKERTLATAQKRIEREQERLEEARAFLASVDEELDTKMSEYDELAERRSEITGDPERSADEILSARDEARRKSQAPDTVTA